MIRAPLISSPRFFIPGQDEPKLTTRQEISLVDCSEVVKFVVKRNHFITLTFYGVLLLRVAATVVFVAIIASTTLRDADSHVEVSDLMSVLARCWHFDRTSPVVVEVAEAVGELLELDARQDGLVERHVEVGGQHAALSRA